MLEILKFILSSFWIWLGTVFIIVFIGWALNAVLLGIRGKECDIPTIMMYKR